MRKRGDKSMVLGLDIGPNSIGWALLSDGPCARPDKIIASGVRVFKAGLDDIERDGKGKSPNVDRREARSRRRMIERKSRRLKNLAVALQKAKLLPGNYDLEDSDQQNLLFEELDRKLDSPYKLRARALDEKLPAFSLGRAIYHLAQRRGFWSNRKNLTKNEKELGPVKKAISVLEEKIQEARARTLGEYFSKIDPVQTRIRQSYTSRKMYESEFELIWDSQKRYYPEILDDDFKEKAHRLIFFQRPLKSSKELVGECELENGRKRAPWSILIAQRFRYLQTLNNLRIFDEQASKWRELNADEHQISIDSLETKGDLNFKKLKKMLKLPETTRFNLESGGEKRIPGNRIVARLIKTFGKDRWAAFSETERDAVVEDINSIVKDETLKKRGLKRWNLDEKEAEVFSRLAFEDGYCSFSRQALRKLIPALEKGLTLPQAIKELYPERSERSVPEAELLPALSSAEMPELRNPIVERSLGELRKMVNAIIKRYGKPHLIRIELGRDLRQSAKQRMITAKRMRIREKERKEAAKLIADETGIQNPSRADIEKTLLAIECDWECPYTGRHISVASLFGDHPQFDVEHIIPLDRCLDNSFLNKTLCDARENRDKKHNRTPYEAYYGTAKWDEIVSRVSQFKGDLRFEKRRRFQMPPEEVEKLLDNFTSRQLNDMRWSAKWAKKYIGLLYGGVNNDGIDERGKRRVQAIGGPVTAILRYNLGLNNLLGDDNLKSRDDHRHHAVDAITVGLTEPSIIKKISDAARRSSGYGKDAYKDFPQPSENFHERVKETVDNIIVSHMVSRRVRGPLHQESFYSPPRKDEKGKQYVTIRKSLTALSERDVGNIIDPLIKCMVIEKLNEREGGPGRVFANEENYPQIKGKNRLEIPVRRARIRVNAEHIFKVGQGSQARYVQSDANHHMEIVVTKKGDKTAWEGYVVSMFEAYQRLKNGQAVIKKDFGVGKKFLFSVAGGEIIELDNHEGDRSLYVVRTVPKSKWLYFVPINDARKLRDIGKKGLTASPERLRKQNCKKMVVTSLGEIRYAND